MLFNQFFPLIPVLCFLVVVAHGGDKAFLGAIRANHNAYQRFNILCVEGGRRFSYYNRICQFSVTRILSIYVTLLIFKELTSHSYHPPKECH